MWIENRFKELRATNDSNLLSPCAEEGLDDDDLSCDSNLSSDNDEDPVFQMTDTDYSHPPPPPRHEFDEFPDHEAQDAVPDPISQNLEDDSRFPELPFKWKEWEDGDVIEPEPGHMAPEEFEFRDTFDKKKAFKNALTCFQTVTGIDREFMLYILANMNEYGEERKTAPKTNKSKPMFAGSPWRRFDLKELHTFLGILLRGGLTRSTAGGYESWFNPHRQTIQAKSGRGALMYPNMGCEAWAREYMKLRRFKQFLAAFRIEKDRTFNTSDKCYQLTRLCVQISEHSKKVFVPPKNLSFDEGGLGCRSRRCPVRQYNKDKPEKYRVDFFILAFVTGFILHLEPYQGKNHANVSQTQTAQMFPTTQKAVLNAAEKSDLKNSPDGHRVITMDNRYTAPSLFVTLLFIFRIGAIGTCRAKRKGWDPDQFTMTKNMERGATKKFYDKVKCIQWNDNKVVTIMSTAWCEGEVGIRRRVGSDVKTFQIEKAVKGYQDTMGGVDHGDQKRTMAGGWKRSVKFKKWFKPCILLGIFDFAALNAGITWNKRSEEVDTVKKLTHYEYLKCLSFDFLNWEDEEHLQSRKRTSEESSESSKSPPTTPSSSDGAKEIHRIVPSLCDGKRHYCVICKLERPLLEMYNLQKESKKGDGSERTQNHLVQCSQCKIFAHNSFNTCKRKIFTLPEFENKTCFEILHMLHEDEHGGLLNIKHGKATTISKVHPIHAKLADAYRNEHGSPVHTREELNKMKTQKKKDRLKRRELDDDDDDE